MSDYLLYNSPSTNAINIMEDEFDGGVPNARIMINNFSIVEGLEYKEKFLPFAIWIVSILVHIGLMVKFTMDYILKYLVIFEEILAILMVLYVLLKYIEFLSISVEIEFVKTQND